MIKSNGKRNVAFLSTCLPRVCGLATFTQDLLNEFESIEDFNAPRVIALNDNKTYSYGSHVMAQIDQENRNDYKKTAEEINHSNVDLLIIQHEFGIYGGESGEYVLELAENLKIPFIVIFHTVLTNPSPKQHDIVKRLADLSVKSVTMAENTIADFTSIYGIALNKMVMLHHGVPLIQTESREKLKENYGLSSRQVLSTFGFLSPGKGIEYGIEAMGRVAIRHPEALYIVWGQTHPVVKERTGEVYRKKLTDLVTELGLENHVKFVDKLLTQEEVIQSLVLSDIYLTPYLGKEQAVSGTLAYGVGYGRVIVSTPYRYAVEMLADGRGLLADFRDSVSLEACILEILENPLRKEEMEARTSELGRTMMWKEVANSYAALCREAISSHYSDKGSVI
jgi:glycosyltransferase involved in cell wall biosynthesis